MSSSLHYVSTDASNAIPVLLVSEAKLKSKIASLTSQERAWIAAQHFTGKFETCIALPDADGNIAKVIAGVGSSLNIWSLAHLPMQLPEGKYVISDALDENMIEALAVGVGLAQYQFARYKAVESKFFQLVLPDAAICERVIQQVEAITLARDLINTPTNDMGPTELAASAFDTAKRMSATCSVITGDDLLKNNYPAIHAVGRASTNPPCLIDIRWGDPKHPRVTLVGKGVCFDTGGLDIKPYSSMKLMKKDMGGAALMLGLAQLLAARNVPICLRVLIPAVENAIAGNAYRPQDVLATRKGLTVEIGSTDAEGRVILADALAEADSESPDLLIDAATLTGAARTALGTELPALFSSDRVQGTTLMEHGFAVHDPMWQLPLWENYDRYVKSPIADITNSPSYAYAGAITAALFLRRFVSGKTKLWMHIDTMAWNIDAQAGRPVGGEALGLRALFNYIEARYDK